MDQQPELSARKRSLKKRSSKTGWSVVGGITGAGGCVETKRTLSRLALNAERLTARRGLLYNEGFFSCSAQVTSQHRCLQAFVSQGYSLRL